jgi:predicted NUDIX family phosphoesterase
MGKKALCVDSEDYLKNKLNVKNFYLLDRDVCETDPRYRQIIPYVLILHPKDGKFLMYQRGKSGNESRLHSLYSLGFGGHVENMANPDNLYNELAMSAARELKEEINYDCSYEELKDIRTSLEVDSLHIALSDETATNVDKVHLGLAIVFIADVNKLDNLIEEEDVIKDTFWLCPKSIRSQGWELETWSKLALDHFIPA